MTADGDLPNLQQLIEERDAARARAEASRRRLVALQSAALALSAARSVPAAVEVVLNLGLDAAGADAGAVAVADHDAGVLRTFGETGTLALAPEVPLDASTPLGRVAAGREPLLAATPDRFPPELRLRTGLDGVAPAAALAALPLVSGTRSIGVLVLSFARPQDFDPHQVLGLDTLAQVAAAALVRIQLVEDEERARAEIARSSERNAFLAQATAVVSAALDERAVLERLARLCVPRLGDWCSITRPRGPVLERVLVHHHDPELGPLARSLEGAELPIDGRTPVSRTYRSGVPQVLRDLAAAMAVDANVSPEHLDAFRRLGDAAGITVPIGPASRPVGVLAFAVGADRELTEDDVSLAVEIALRAGIAVTHAESFARERDAAALLQSAILPNALPAVPGVELAAAYRPADAGRTIGGDWYDAARLDGDRLALVVGDVAGHGLEAATDMGQLRSALRAFLFEGHPPGVALALVNRMLRAEPTPHHATAIVATIDLRRGRLVLASAGHVPPLLLRRTGVRHHLDRPHGPMLGVLADATYPSVEIGLEADDVLVLFTDGLIERRRRSVDDTIADLAAAITASPPRPGQLAAWCDALIREQRRDRDHDDDSCLLVVRASSGFPPHGLDDPPAPATPALHLDSRPGVARQVRQWLATLLGEHPRLAEVQLCATEVVTNVVVHARTPLTVSLHELPGGGHRVAVRDLSVDLPRIQPHRATAPQGRGLQLVDALSTRWGTDVIPGAGKVVWFEFEP